MKCVANCGQLMNPSYRLVLTAQCKICHNMTYSWQLHRDDSTSANSVRRLQPSDAMLGLRDPVLNVNPNVFSSGRMETYVVVLSGELLSCKGKTGKVFPYSLPSVGPGADPGVQAVSPQVT